jgi:hypothetical protein
LLIKKRPLRTAAVSQVGEKTKLNGIIWLFVHNIFFGVICFIF